MNLERVYVTQRRLRNPAQIPQLVKAVEEGAALPPVVLCELEDGTIYIQDGHHRCLAFILAGRAELRYGEFILCPVDHARPLRGRLTESSVVRQLLGLP